MSKTLADKFQEEKMATCSCGHGKAIFFCNRNPPCSNQQYYCTECGEGEAHDHRPVFRATETVKQNDKWLKLKEPLQELTKKAGEYFS
jgi:hypothetical protein